ncbi:MAG: hypothetical protein ACOZAR_00440 [Patescibacteria group bacterium]
MSTQQDLEALKNLDKKENLPGEAPGQQAGFSPDSALSSLTQMETGVNKQVEAGLTPGTTLDNGSVLSRVEGQKLSGGGDELDKQNIVLQRKVENLNSTERKSYEDFIKVLIENNISQPRIFFLSHPEYIDVFKQGTPDIGLFLKANKDLNLYVKESYKNVINAKKFGKNWREIFDWETENAINEGDNKQEKDSKLSKVAQKYELSAVDRETRDKQLLNLEYSFYLIKGNLVGGLSVDDFKKYHVDAYLKSQKNLAGQ